MCHILAKSKQNFYSVIPSVLRKQTEQMTLKNSNPTPSGQQFHQDILINIV